jgi:hypothetical protein
LTDSPTASKEPALIPDKQQVIAAYLARWQAIPAADRAAILAEQARLHANR